MKLKVTGFNRDEGNRAKCESHGISVEEIEAFFRQGHFLVAPDIKHSEMEKRLLAIGRTANGRAVLVIFIERNELIRPVSARYMHQKEFLRYEKKDPTF
jgi:uncharacterized protein